MLDNELISKIQNVLKKQIPAFQKGIATSCGIGKDIYVDVNGKSIRAYSYNVSSPGQVNVFYDNTNKIYVAWTEQSNQLLNTINLRLRKSKLRGTVEKLLYPFLEIVAETGITQPYWVIGGNNKTLLLPANSNSPFEMLGLNNLGDGKFTWVGNMNDTYYFGNEVPDTGGSGLVATAIDLIPSQFINEVIPNFAWKGGKQLSAEYVEATNWTGFTNTTITTTASPSHRFTIDDEGGISFIYGNASNEGFGGMYSYIDGEGEIFGILDRIYNSPIVPSLDAEYLGRHQGIGQPIRISSDFYYVDDAGGSFQVFAYFGNPINLTPSYTINRTVTFDQGTTTESYTGSGTLDLSYEGQSMYHFNGFRMYPTGGHTYRSSSTQNYTSNSSYNVPNHYYQLTENGLTKDEFNIVVTKELECNQSKLSNTEESATGSYHGGSDYKTVDNVSYSSEVTNEVNYTGIITRVGNFAYKLHDGVTTPRIVKFNTILNGSTIIEQNFDFTGGTQYPDSIPGTHTYSKNNSSIFDYELLEPSTIYTDTRISLVRIFHQQYLTTKTRIGSGYDVFGGATAPTTPIVPEHLKIVQSGTKLNLGLYVKYLKIFYDGSEYTFDEDYKGFMFRGNSTSLTPSTSSTIYGTNLFMGISDDTTYPEKLYTGYKYNQTLNVYSDFTFVNNSINISNIKGTNVDIFAISNGVTKLFKGTISEVETNTTSQQFGNQNYLVKSCSNVQVNISSEESIDFYCWANVYSNAIIIVPSGDHTISLLKYIEQDKTTVNMYEKNDTVQIAISKDPTNTDVEKNQDKWYADIYEFDKINKKFIRLENQSGALSKINNATTDLGNFISYYPLT